MHTVASPEVAGSCPPSAVSYTFYKDFSQKLPVPRPFLSFFSPLHPLSPPASSTPLLLLLFFSLLRLFFPSSSPSNENHHLLVFCFVRPCCFGFLFSGFAHPFSFCCPLLVSSSLFLIFLRLTNFPLCLLRRLSFLTSFSPSPPLFAPPPILFSVAFTCFFSFSRHRSLSTARLISLSLSPCLPLRQSPCFVGVGVPPLALVV